jgi:hypothetical protein
MGHRRNLLEVDALEYGGLDLTKPQLRYRYIHHFNTEASRLKPT